MISTEDNPDRGLAIMRHYEEAVINVRRSSVVLMLYIKEGSQRRLRVLKCIYRSINLELAGAVLL
jgi:hypothetical protein